MNCNTANTQTARIIVDTTVPVCPLCHTSPIVTEHVFMIQQMLTAQEAKKSETEKRKPRKIKCDTPKERFAYYHCSCGECTTNWYGARTLADGTELSPRQAARMAYIDGHFTTMIGDLQRRGVDCRDYRRLVMAIRESEKEIAAMNEEKNQQQKGKQTWTE